MPVQCDSKGTHNTGAGRLPNIGDHSWKRIAKQPLMHTSSILLAIFLPALFSKMYFSIHPLRRAILRHPEKINVTQDCKSPVKLSL